MKQEFKVGDKVYFPSLDGKIHTLEEPDCTTYPLAIKNGGYDIPFTLKGHRYNDDPLPSIFHATPENRELLTQLYGIEFDAPPTPKEVIQAMLDDGWVCVPCYAANNLNEKSNKHSDLIVAIDENKFKSISNKLWWYAKPIDPKTGRVIIDYADGEIVTE